MEVSVRGYSEGDIPSMTAIWNSIVDGGMAFPQEDPLTEAEAREFFGSQSHCGVAVYDGRVVGLYILHPNNVRTAVQGHSHASEDEVRSVLVVIMMFILTIVAFTIVFMAFGYDTLESVTSVTSALTSFGTGMGQFASNFQMLDPVLKVVMVLLMWMGRLEIITAIAILSPGTWKEQIKDLRHRRRVAAQ